MLKQGEACYACWSHLVVHYLEEHPLQEPGVFVYPLKNAMKEYLKRKEKLIYLFQLHPSLHSHQQKHPVVAERDSL